MKCTNCGYEAEQEFRFCPQCGAEYAPVASNTAAEKILPALKDTLFLVICILMAANCILSITSGGLPLINILMTVFLWLAWNLARTDSTDAQQLRNVSGTVYAQYVINNVVAVLIFVVGAIFALVMGVVMGQADVWEELMGELSAMGAEYLMAADLLASLSIPLLTGIFAVVAVAVLLVNVFAMRNIHRFAKSVYQSLEKKTPALERVNTARVWLYIFGVCDGLGALASLMDGELVSGLTSGTGAAAAVLAAVLIGKYFSQQEN